MEPKKVDRYSIISNDVELCSLFISEHNNGIFFSGVLWLEKGFFEDKLKNTDLRYRSFIANNYNDAKKEALGWIKNNICSDFEINAESN